MSEKKYYVVGVTKPEVWDQVHEALTQDGSLDDNIPKRSVECVDQKDHSPTRAVYLMTDEEVELLTHDPDIKFVQIDQSYYPDLYPPCPEELRSNTRYDNSVKNYYNFTNLLPGTPTATDANRAGYQLLRTAQYANPWFGQGSSTIINSTVPISNTGRNVDLIVGDEGCWFGHVEFQNNPTGGVELPRGYTGGNLLPGNGTCDLLDVVLEGPYYIDPDWFNADPANRLTTRWDGTIVPVELVARNWWASSSLRSPQFAGAGTVPVPQTYTRANCNGSNTVETPGSEGQHGTACSGLAYGRTFGWAYNANKWVIDAYGNFGFGLNVDLYFDVVKIFHQNKPINPVYGTRDPTVSSNSWGFRATIPTTGFYYYNQGTSGSGGVAYSGTKPEFMQYLGNAGDGGRAKGEMIDNNLTTAGDELIASGVIFVVAAGNSNQQQVSSTHPNFNNYWSLSSATPLATATHNEFGSICFNTTSRRGFPQQLGKYTADGQVVYPAINIGALDDAFTVAGLERKVNYSDMGNQIDAYFPADGTLTSNQSYSPQFLRYDQLASAVIPSLGFSGICSASAVLATTGTLSITPNTGNQITTGAGTATVTSIPSSLFGSAGLSASTIPTVGDNDDGFWDFALPFNISYNGITYSSVYVGANSYITFGAGSQQWSGLGPTNPNLPKIMISAADNSAQRVYFGTVGTAPNRTYRIRFEGTNARFGTVGNPNMVWEATFYENAPAQIDLQIGVNANGVPSPLLSYDCGFGGTSAACPVAAGLIATALETNRNWGWADVRTWLHSLNEQSDTTFYQGPDPDSANSVAWADLNSLMGGTRRVGYNNISTPFTGVVTFGGAGLTMSGAGFTITAS